MTILNLQVFFHRSTIAQTCYGKRAWVGIKWSNSYENGGKVPEEYELQAQTSIHEIRNEVGCEGIEFKKLE